MGTSPGSFYFTCRAVKRVRVVKEPVAPKKPLVQPLRDKLQELKRKMTEDDRATDEFLSAIRGNDKPTPFS